MTTSVYDTIGKTYDNTRQADPDITQKLYELLCPIAEGKYLDIGCGSGNYTGALAAQGLKIEGVDLSLEMLTKARNKYPNIMFHHGDARQLNGFRDNPYDGAVCVLATHHIGHLPKAFEEIYRVIKQGHLVIFTATPEQMQHYWLCHYFPKMMQESSKIMTSFKVLETALKQAGFHNIKKQPFFVTHQLKDWFLHAGKYRPEIYLDENVRAGISSFQLFSNPDELAQGIKRLKMDIDSGKIHQIIEQYEHPEGDYCFITAKKG